jgi:hypothetical protein
VSLQDRERLPRNVQRFLDFAIELLAGSVSPYRADRNNR